MFLRNVLLGSYLALMTHVAFAEINFREVQTQQAWEQALADAKSDGKLVFIDFYTDWCGWCKRMDQDTYADPNVASYYNQAFINIKVDAEKGFGPNLAQTFEVSGFPYFAFVNDKGSLNSSTSGYRKPDAFIQFAKMAVKSENEWSAQVKSWESGSMTTSELTKFTLAADKRNENELANAAFDKYFFMTSDEQKQTKEGFELISSFGYVIDSDAQNYLFKYKQAYTSLPDIGEEGFRAYLGQVLYFNSKVMIITDDYTKLDQIVNKLAPHLLTTETTIDKLKFDLKAYFLIEGQKWSSYIAEVDKKYTEITNTNFEAFSGLIAYHITEQKSDSDEFNQANVRWSKSLRDFRKNYATQFTYSIAKYRAGDTEGALSGLEKARSLTNDQEQLETLDNIINSLKE